jgi:transglutaminase-like putative cysteine protease
MKPLKLKLAIGRKSKNPLDRLPIPKGAVTWLVFSLALAVGWHIPHTQIWAVAAAVIFGGWAYWLILKEKPLPPAKLKILLAVGSVIGIIITYRSYLGRDPGITTLIILSTLKLMELKTRRDFMIIVFLCYFLVFGNFLYDQSIEDLIFTLTAALLITGALFRLNHPETETKKKKKVKVSFVLRFSFRLFLFCIPFTIILFFLFPRTSGPLWNLSQDSLTRYLSGINDELRPGQIAELAKSTLPAFQVQFPRGNMPENRDLYFRGLILWFVKGGRWGRWYQGILPARYRRSGPMTAEGILQVITLHPHNQRWLFGLDRPVVFPRWTGVLPGGIFQSPRTIKSLYRYQVLSKLNPEVNEDLDETQRGWALRLPRYGSRRIIALGRQWRSSASTDREIVRMAEDYFKQGGFVFTLKPGKMDEDDPYEDFLFNKRKGFCEHYAATFALLMRAAGVPARVIVGYQGGEYNSVGKYLMVRQSEAHAWSEVWFEGEGWQRVDPTAWVAPERLEYGVEMSESLSSMRNLTDETREEEIRKRLRGNIFKRVWKFIKHHWDNINYNWDVWIISFDRFRQREFLKNLGIERVGRLGLLGALVVIIPTLFFLLSYLLKRQALSTDPVLKLYQVFCSKLARAGLQRLRWEGPIHFEQRAVKKFPQKAKAIHRFTDLFVHLRYGKLEVNKPHLKQLKRYITKL